MEDTSAQPISGLIADSSALPVNKKPAARQARSMTTKRAVLDAATQLFAEKGYEDTSVDEIVQASGVSLGSMYHQFGGKLEVFLALAQEVLNRHAAASVRASNRAAHARPADPVAAYVAGAHAFLMSVWEDRGITRIMIGEGPAGYSVMRHEALDRFRHGTEGLTMGDPPLPDSTGYAVTAMTQAAAMQIVDVHDRRTAELVADYFMDLLTHLFASGSTV